MSRTLSQLRASHWVNRIGKVGFADGSKEWGDAANFARALPTQIRTNGLGLAIAQHMGSPKKGENFVLGSAADWLIGEAATNGSPYGGGSASVSALLDKIIAGSAFDYMRAVEEMMAWLEWGKPMLDAKAPKQNRSAAPEEPRA